MRKAILIICILLILSSFFACSPGYVVRAGWEEAGILLRRKSIQKLIDDENTEEETRRKFRLVLEARDFAKKLGLEPKGSFSQYSKIDRDVLVWVLTGADKTSLTPVTWWFPIVGSVPYKGFFEKEDGLEAMEALRAKGYDLFLRPSAAFSTLGWFNDPLLSTTLKSGDIDLINTVIHEILHNTIWVSNQVAFNESLANFVGSRGVAMFFEEKLGKDATFTQEAENSWADQLTYAKFLDGLASRLKAVYEAGQKRTEAAETKDEREKIKAEILAQREKVFAEAKTDWGSFVPTLKTKRFEKAAENLNNAVVLAQVTYFHTPWVFEQLYESCDRSLPRAIQVVKEAQETSGFKDDPFRILEEKVRLLRQTEHGTKPSRDSTI